MSAIYPEREGRTHKDMGEAFISQHALDEWMKANNLAFDNFTPSSEGGFILQDGVPRYSVRSPFWRPVQGSPDLSLADIQVLNYADHENASLEGIESGGELELLIWDPSTEDTAAIMSPGGTVPQRLHAINTAVSTIGGDPFLPPEALFVHFSAEVTNSCLEVDFHHSPDPLVNALAMVHTIKTVADLIEEEGLLITPVSLVPHRALKEDDISKDPYIQRNNFGYKTWERARHALSAAFQVHVDMLSLESGISALNRYQEISYLISALASAGPFLHGNAYPNLSSIYGADHEIVRNVAQTTDWLSARYFARIISSRSGGIYVEPLPEDRDLFFMLAREGLKDDDPTSHRNIPTPSRVGGHHRDRVRIDKATLETTNMDTFGGNIYKLAAVQEFTRVLLWKLQRMYQNPHLSSQVLNERPYQTLFSAVVSKEVLERAHQNNIEIARHGVSANIRAADDQVYSAFSLLQVLIDFVQEPLDDFGGLHTQIVTELRKSALAPSDDHFDLYKDGDGLVSMIGFYETGIGTISHWLKKRAQQLVERGMTEEDAVKNCMTDLGISYHHHLKKITPELITQFFTE